MSQEVKAIIQWTLIVYRNTDKWHSEWLQVTTSNGKKRMTMNDTTSDSEWEQLKKSDFKLQNETKGHSDS